MMQIDFSMSNFFYLFISRPLIKEKIQHHAINKALQEIRMHYPFYAVQIQGYFDGEFESAPNAKRDIIFYLDKVRRKSGDRLSTQIDKIKSYIE